MAPIKFEENIKDKLENRKITPSSESWSKLSERLDADDNTSKKPMYWWLSMAAGLLLLVAISIQFFSSNESEKVLPKMVEEEVINKQLQNEQLESNPKESIELANEDKSTEEAEAVVPTINNSKVIDYKEVINKKPKPQTQLVNETQPAEKPNKKNEEAQLHNEAKHLLEEAKLKLAVAEAMATIKSEDTSVTDREIDSLLKLASKELFRDNLQKKATRTVDAKALLMSVEDEMGQSFRSRVFEALKESYETVKTAVVDRNN